MSTKDTGGPAFPNPALADPGFSSPTDLTGMTLRDYFAAKAMQGELSDGGAERHDETRLADWCYRMADAMLKARQA
jgi:hypothetical protein